MILSLSKVQDEFMSLFQPSQPGNLLVEMLVFLERLSEGRLTPHYTSANWQYKERSLYAVLFGEDSRLSDCLISLIIHPEEQVLLQAYRVILKLQLSEGTEKAANGANSTPDSFISGNTENTTVVESDLMSES